MSHKNTDPDFDFERDDGVPALPAGETILWQGKPGFEGLAVRALHARKVAIYFAAFMAWRFASALAGGRSLSAAGDYAFGLVPFALVGVGILCIIAWGYARTTVYTLTSNRLLIRSGMALPVTTSLPLSLVSGASLKAFADGSGDIPLTISGPERVNNLAIWPHVRPWTWSHPQPMLRAVPDAAGVARLLAKALGGEPARAPAPARADQPFVNPVAAHA